MLFFKPNIKKLETKNDINGLAQIIRKYNKNQETQIEAIRALSRINNSNSEKILKEATKHNVERVKKEAIHALGNFKSKEVVKILIKVLLDNNISISEEAAKSIKSIGDESIPELIKLLKDKGIKNRKKASKVLIEMGNLSIESLIKIIANEEKAVKKIATDILVNIGRPAILPLLDSLEYADEALLRRVFNILVRLGTICTDSLIRLLENPNENIRKETLIALAEIKDEKALDSIQRACEDSSESVRLKAIKALGKIGNKASTKILIMLLNEANIPEKIESAKALTEIGDTNAINALLNSMKTENVELRDTIISALINVGFSDYDEIKKFGEDVYNKYKELQYNSMENLISNTKQPISKIIIRKNKLNEYRLLSNNIDKICLTVHPLMVPKVSNKLEFVAKIFLKINPNCIGLLVFDKENATRIALDIDEKLTPNLPNENISNIVLEKINYLKTGSSSPISCIAITDYKLQLSKSIEFPLLMFIVFRRREKNDKIIVADQIEPKHKEKIDFRSVYCIGSASKEIYTLVKSQLSGKSVFYVKDPANFSKSIANDSVAGSCSIIYNKSTVYLSDDVVQRRASDVEDKIRNNYIDDIEMVYDKQNRNFSVTINTKLITSEKVCDIVNNTVSVVQEYF